MGFGFWMDWDLAAATLDQTTQCDSALGRLQEFQLPQKRSSHQRSDVCTERGTGGLPIEEVALNAWVTLEAVGLPGAGKRQVGDRDGTERNTNKKNTGKKTA